MGVVETERIYLDNAATTPLHPSVLASMQPFMTNSPFGNPSSVHQMGREARRALETARGTVAHAIGAAESEIVFTGGGTEADFLALFGMLHAGTKRHVVTTAIEHHAILHTCDFLKELGYEATLVNPHPDGSVTAKDMLAAVRPDTGLVSMMWANNETGAIQPVETLSAALRDFDVPMHSDAVQAFIGLPIDVRRVAVSSLSISGHKIFGPKGVGALYLRQGTPYQAIIRGGAQERNRRAGTENLAAIVGFARAVELHEEERKARVRQLQSLRDYFVNALQSRVGGVHLFCEEKAVPQIVNVSFSGVLAETLLMNLDLAGVYASSGSACTAGTTAPSHVLLAAGWPQEMIRGAVRFSFSSDNTQLELERAVSLLEQLVGRLRNHNSAHFS